MSIYSQNSRQEVCQSSLFSSKNTSWLSLLSELTPSCSLFLFLLLLLSRFLPLCLNFSSKLFIRHAVTPSPDENIIKIMRPVASGVAEMRFSFLHPAGCGPSFYFVRKSSRGWLDYMKMWWVSFIINQLVFLLAYFHANFTNILLYAMNISWSNLKTSNHIFSIEHFMTPPEKDWTVSD